MFDKAAAALATVALGAGAFAVYKVEQMPPPVTAAAVQQLVAEKTAVPVVPQAEIEAMIAERMTGEALNSAVSEIVAEQSDDQIIDKAVAEYLSKNKDVMDALVAQYIEDNPETMIASLQAYELEQRAEQQRSQAERDITLVADNKEEIFTDGYSFVGGNPDGDVTVVEFSDYNCGYCKRAHTEVKNFIEADGNIRLVVKEFPILGPGSVVAGRAALASALQEDGEKYQAFNDALMSHRGSHSEATVMKIADTVGLDVEQLKTDMKSPAVDVMVKRTSELADKLSINGTPAFIIGNSVVRGFVPAADLKKLAEMARSS